MVMGERIKPGTAQAVGTVNKTAGETVGDHSPAPTPGPVPVKSKADVKPAAASRTT